jgi:hypothetical protein
VRMQTGICPSCPITRKLTDPARPTLFRRRTHSKKLATREELAGMAEAIWICPLSFLAEPRSFDISVGVLEIKLSGSCVRAWSCRNCCATHTGAVMHSRGWGCCAHLVTWELLRRSRTECNLYVRLIQPIGRLSFVVVLREIIHLSTCQVVKQVFFRSPSFLWLCTLSRISVVFPFSFAFLASSD